MEMFDQENVIMVWTSNLWLQVNPFPPVQPCLQMVRLGTLLQITVINVLLSTQHQSDSSQLSPDRPPDQSQRDNVINHLNQQGGKVSNL